MNSGAIPISVSGLDPLIHPLARLQLMALLAEVTDIEFAVLRELLAISDSLLSKHLAVLTDAGYVRLTKAKANGRQRTWVAITAAGGSAFARHVAALQALAANSMVVGQTLD
jgi:DNA-binding MarR family transcriptional regulator